MNNKNSRTDIVPVSDMHLAEKSDVVIDDMLWNEIVDRLVEELSGDDIPDNVIRATEMLVSGYPTYKVAKALNVKTETVRRWMVKYPTMSIAISESRKLLAKWRMAQLEQQFLTAVERSGEILEVDLENRDVNVKLLGILAQHSRYIIGLFAGQKIDVDVTVTHEAGETVLKARRDALDYMLEKSKELDLKDEPIDVTYRVVDSKIDNDIPMLNSDNEPNFGSFGEIDVNDDGALCHICGERYTDLKRHILSKHNMSTAEYEALFLLDDGEVRNALSKREE